MDPLFRKVGIFGVGLLGGSIALGLRDRFLAQEVHAYDPDPMALEAARGVGAVDYAHPTLGPWVEELELGILAAPVGELTGLSEALAPYATATLWTDVGSVKSSVVREVTPLLPHFVPGHPMTGSERAGVQNAHAGLLHNAVWILTPTSDTANQDTEQIIHLVKLLGAYPLLLSPEQHDRLVARVSHLPYLLAVALNLLIKSDPQSDTLMYLASGGFRDLTRVASGSPKMSRDMVQANQDAVQQALSDFRQVLRGLELELNQPEQLLGSAESAKLTRDALPIVRRGLLPRLYELIVQLPDQPGELARITSCLGEASVNIKDIEVLSIREEGGALRLGFASEEERETGRLLLRSAGYRAR